MESRDKDLTDSKNGSAAFEKARTITQEQIARKAGASTAAVSSLYSGRYYSMDRRHPIGISVDTRQRIIEASRALGYQPPEPAWRVRLYPETGDFCFLLSDNVGGGFTDSYFSRLLSGALSRLEAMQRHLVCGRFNESTDYLACPELLPPCVAAGTASRYLLAGAPNESLLNTLRQMDFLAVYLSRNVAVPGICSVAPDFAAASRMAIEHLLALGHRRILIASSSYYRRPAWNTVELTRGVNEAFAGAGIPFAEADIVQLPEDYQRGGRSAGSEVSAALLSRRQPPTAVFCYDDWVALEILRLALASGLGVPRDVSIIGCNGSQFTAGLHPSLSTVHIPAERMGELGVEQLEIILREGAPDEARTIILPVELLQRDSTAPPKGDLSFRNAQIVGGEASVA